MNLFILIPIAVVLLVLGIFLRIQLIKRRHRRTEALQEEQRQQRVQDLRRLVDRAEAGDVEARQQIADNDRTYPFLSGDTGGLSARVWAIVEDVRAKAQYTQLYREISVLLAEQAKLANEDFTGRFAIALKLLEPVSELAYGNGQLIEEVLGVTHESMLTSAKELVMQHCRKLSAEAGENRAAFMELVELLADSRRYRGKVKRVGVSDIPYPEEWNKWVAKYYSNPSIKQFDLGGEPEPGALRLRAALAIRTGDCTEAKIVLAYAKSVNAVVAREELGVLAAELAKMVDSFNEEEGLNAPEDQTTDVV